MNEEQPKLPNRKSPFSEAFKQFIPQGWAAYQPGPERAEAADWTPARRDRLAAQFPGERLVIPAGELKVRSNDTDFAFRPHSAFAYLTGLGTDREPEAVLVLEPKDNGYEETLYFRPRAPRTDEEFYASARYGEMWVGQRESLEEMRELVGFPCAPIDELPGALAKDADSVRIRVLRGSDTAVTAQVEEIRVLGSAELDDELTVAVSEMRFCKDAWEAEQLRDACRKTAVGFAAVVADLPQAVKRGRGERWVEGVFGLYARHQGNDVGYGTIAAAGDHANTLHWVRNDGDVKDGDLLLLDAGVETDTLYTADVTRTLPISGRFSPAQRKVYDAVLEAQEAGIAACKPGNSFADIHKAAIAVVVRYLHEWGVLPVTPEESLDPERGGHHRRWMVHGTSHHLGLDVHDCAQARNEHYKDGTLKPGMVVTVEPGIYFKATDLMVPEELRGIGVRIEDDILITDDGCENLSAMLPRAADDLQAWMAPLLTGEKSPTD